MDPKTRGPIAEELRRQTAEPKSRTWQIDDDDKLEYAEHAFDEPTEPNRRPEDDEHVIKPTDVQPTKNGLITEIPISEPVGRVTVKTDKNERMRREMRTQFASADEGPVIISSARGQIVQADRVVTHESSAEDKVKKEAIHIANYISESDELFTYCGMSADTDRFVVASSPRFTTCVQCAVEYEAYYPGFKLTSSEEE